MAFLSGWELFSHFLAYLVALTLPTPDMVETLDSSSSKTEFEKLCLLVGLNPFFLRIEALSFAWSYGEGVLHLEYFRQCSRNLAESLSKLEKNRGGDFEGPDCTWENRSSALISHKNAGTYAISEYLGRTLLPAFPTTSQPTPVKKKPISVVLKLAPKGFKTMKEEDLETVFDRQETEHLPRTVPLCGFALQISSSEPCFARRLRRRR